MKERKKFYHIILPVQLRVLNGYFTLRIKASPDTENVVIDIAFMN